MGLTRIVHVGTSQRTQGGVAAVIRIAFSADEAPPDLHIETHCDGSAATKIKHFLRGWGRLVADLASHPNTLYHFHVSTRGSLVRKTLCAVVVKAFGRPLVFHVHSGLYRDYYEQGSAFRRLFIRRALTLADLIIVLSPEWAAFFRRIAPYTEISVVGNAVTMPTLPTGDRWPLGQRWRIAMLGRLGKNKGTFDLVEALANAGIDAELHLAGDGDLTATRSLADKLEIGDRVILRGWIGADERAALLSGAQIFALPSYAEGLPMALLEAMSYGLPVVTCPVGGIASTVCDNENGILVRPGDVPAIVEALKKLHSRPEDCKRLGEAARRTIVERFDARAFCESLNELHTRLATRKTG